MGKSVRTSIIVLSIMGTVVTGVLLSLHSAGAGSEGILASVCGKGGGCDRVLESRWAYFPPVELTEGTKPWAVPVALLGAIYFMAFAVWGIGVGWLRGRRSWVNSVVVGGGVMGVVGSIGFLALMALVVKAVCPYCLATHLINFALIGTLVTSFIRQRRGLKEKDSPLSEAPSLVWPAAVMASLAVAITVGYGNLLARAENQALKKNLAEIEEDSGVLEMAFYGQEVSRVSLREDDGAEGRDRDPTLDAAPGYRNTLVVFGDAECSACRRFHQMLDSEIRPLYGSHLRITFKHLPLPGIHPNAMASAQALEAARAQGKFWKYLEALYERQEKLAGLDYVALAANLGLDREQFFADMESEAVNQRISEDIKLAADLGLAGTPAVYLNNRRVSGSIRNLVGFWQSQADRLKVFREKKGQGWNPEGLVDSTVTEP